MIVQLHNDMPNFSRVLLTCHNVMKGFFPKEGKESMISHLSWPLWSSSPFDAVELTSANFLFKNVSDF